MAVLSRTTVLSRHQRRLLNQSGDVCESYNNTNTLKENTPSINLQQLPFNYALIG